MALPPSAVLAGMSSFLDVDVLIIRIVVCFPPGAEHVRPPRGGCACPPDQAYLGDALVRPPAGRASALTSRLSRGLQVVLAA